METYHDYLRTYSAELGARIVEMYPPLQGPKDPIAPALKTLLRKPLPAQAMTITGIAKYLKTEDSVRLVGECGTGKTLMSNHTLTPLVPVHLQPLSGRCHVCEKFGELDAN